ncbi:MAG TPA: carboxypeptidase-like regulatory domain-containing protein [Terriglobia bacterium]|nr:carboxypeptidase-like regulatory domain-containing protein [Terriglobia bacterium]
MKLRIVILAYACLLAPLAGSAQTLATIVGTVTDASGAVVPGAQITVVSGETGFVRKLVSNRDGNYTAARIPLGNYVVTAVASGFQRLTRTGIVLNAGQTLRVDLRLTVGSAQQQVTVQGNVSQVQTDTAEISDTVTGEQIHQLNIPAENFANLALLIPGAAPLAGGFQPTVIEDIATDTLPVNGVPGNMNNWEIDGTNDVDQGSGSDSLQIFPSLDAISEFHISTSNYSAEYAKSGSAIIEIATKSGTDKFHGSMFEFLQNDALDANDWFLNRTIAPAGGNAPKQVLKHNNFGFTLGGPFYIPGHYNTNKQKTFFFISEEWRENRDGTVLNANVPSTLERQGDFSQCDPTSGDYNAVVASGCQPPVNPATGNKFPGDIVPVSPTGSALLNSLIPLPNNGIIGYTAAPDLPTSFREDDIRVDQNVSDKTRLFVRYTDDAYNQTYIPSLWTSAQFGTVKSLMNIPSKNAVLNITKTFNPTLMNEFIASYSSDVWHVHSVVGFGSPSGSILKPAGFAASTIFPEGASGPFLPAINVSGGGPSFAEDTGYPYWYWNSSPALKDNLAWIRGKHSLKFGAYFLLDRLNEIDPNGGLDSQGVLGFSSSSAVTTGNALADMYLGRIASYSEVGHVINGQLVGGYAAGHLWQEDFEPYFEDDWRATHRLTLNLGIRYYYVTPWKDYTKPTVTSIFVPSQYNPADQAQLDAAGNLVPGTGDNWLNYGNGLDECGAGSIPKGCITVNHATPSPRFGFAWDPTGSGKTVIRGGYALSWDTSNAHMTASGRYGNAPVIGNLSAYNIVGYQSIVPGALAPVSLSSQPLHQGLPQIQQFSLGVQHELPGNNFLSVSYVGTLGRFLQQVLNVNQVPVGVGVKSAPELAGIPGCDLAGNCNVQSVLMNTEEPAAFFAPYRGYTTIDQMQATGNSNYNSLQVNFRHNVGRGLMFQTVYTWSHTLDDLLGGGGTGNFSNGVNDYDMSRWYGTSALNQAQALEMNYIYQLPFFAHASHPFVRTALGGWELSGVTTFETGPPITLTCGISGMASGIGGNVMCNSLGKVGVDKGITQDPQFGPTPTWFNPAAIGQITVPQLAANNEPGMFGYMGKYPITGPGRNDWDLALLKNFSLPWLNGENSNLQFRLETYNTFNHPQWSTVSLFCSGLTAPGQPCNGANNIGNGEVSGDYPPRVLLLALHFTF